jgi:sulfite reductase (NADPH) hemoprotein beta-component
MAAKLTAPTHPVVVTANRLRDGRVVWLAPRATWSEDVRDAQLFSPADAEAGLAAGRFDEVRQLVVGAYATEAEETGHGPEPLLHRERIRAHGPSVAVTPAP